MRLIFSKLSNQGTRPRRVVAARRLGPEPIGVAPPGDQESVNANTAVTSSLPRRAICRGTASASRPSSA
jgi:hypothetical protein